MAEFYRFAVLLTGNAKSAEQIVAEVLREADGQCAQIRNERSRCAWFIAKIRARCPTDGMIPAPRLVRDDSASAADVNLLDIEAFLLAQRFTVLPEPDRSALALFYLDCLSTEEIAKLLKLELTELAEVLGRGREKLEASLRNGEEVVAP